jgi:hypothetical protein
VNPGTGATARAAALLFPAFFAASLVAGASSCAARLTRSETFPPADRRLSLAPYRQEPERCGPFALASVLTFLGRPTAAADLDPALYLPEVEGSLTMDLFLAARRRGLPARQGGGAPAALREELAAGRPAILLLRYGALAGGAGHFVVATGCSSAPPGFFLLWGDGRESWMPEADLSRMWERSGRWMLWFAPEGDGG